MYPPPNTYPHGAFLSAVESGDFGVVHRIILSGPVPDINVKRQQDGMTGLHIAVSKDYNGIASFLLTLPGIQLNERDVYGRSALYLASENGNSEMVEALLQAGADPCLGNSDRTTPLLVGSFSGNAAVVGLLLNTGQVDINGVDDSGKSALHLAAFNGRIEVLRRLLQRGSVVNMQDVYGWTPLMLASHSGHIDIVKALLSAQADVHSSATDGKTAVMIALDNGHEYIASLIQQSGGTHGRFIPDMPHQVMPSVDRTQPTMYPDNSLTYHAPSPALPMPMPNERPEYHPTAANIEEHGQERAPRMQESKDPGKQNLHHTAMPGIHGAEQSTWATFSRVVTVCCFKPLLEACGKKTPDIQQAWREKVAICVIIVILSAIVGFFTFAFAQIVCSPESVVLAQDLAGKYGKLPETPGVQLVSIHGTLYNVASFVSERAHNLLVEGLNDQQRSQVESELVNALGTDLSYLFAPRQPNCPYKPATNCPRNLESGNPIYFCHSGTETNNRLDALSDQIVAPLVYQWETINDSDLKLFAYNQKVYSLNEYLDERNNDKFLPLEVEALLPQLVGIDATRLVLNNATLLDVVPCFETYFEVGMLDASSSGCTISLLIQVFATTVLVGIILIKIVSAVLFSWVMGRRLGAVKPGEQPETNVILLVTCYSEGDDGIRTTLDSLAVSDYADSKKLIFCIADGNITGAGNEKSTPDILKDMITLHPEFEQIPKPYSYISIGSGPKKHNMAEVCAGFYEATGADGVHKVPMVIVNKVGAVAERSKPKAGNRGKRDSQIVLMQFLAKVTFNDRMTPLEFDLAWKIWRLTSISPDQFNVVLMVDADTLVMPDALKQMVKAMERDPNIMGLCGETRIVNKKESWITMIQVYEYFISHHLGKAFEAVFGGVTCLPGCFCMYRIKSPKISGSGLGGGERGEHSFIPILANPDIIEDYASNVVDTLHRKNLLLLGEDRFLTTLMLKTFPKRAMMYVPTALCRTIVPDSFKVLLSQRRRWINSTIHNLMELVFVPELCGIFCCSMQFVVGLELVGTAIMPASLCFLFYLIILAIAGQPNVAAPLIFMLSMFGLQAVLILVTGGKVSYVAWMGAYLSGLAVWNFVLPVYAFWHMDNFSWGDTRKIEGTEDGHGGKEEGAFDEHSIPLKRFLEWVEDRKRAHRRSNTGNSGVWANHSSYFSGQPSPMRPSTEISPYPPGPGVY